MLWGRIHERYQVATQLNNPEINAAVSAAKKEADKRIFSPNHLLSESHLTQKLSWCDLNFGPLDTFGHGGYRDGFD